MWFDAAKALREIEAGTAPASAPVAHVAHVARGEPPEPATAPASSGGRVAHVAAVARPHAPEPDWQELREAFEERAAIREYDGGQSREDAEAGALLDVAASAGVTADVLRAGWGHN